MHKKSKVTFKVTNKMSLWGAKIKMFLGLLQIIGQTYFVKQGEYF